jgi:hypothetical protein
VKRVGRWGAAVAGGVGALVSAWGVPATAADARPVARGGPAVVAGARTMGADELARAGRAVESTPALTIYQSRLADGTLELSDRPPQSAAGAVERLSYGLAPQDAATRQRAEAEREYWRKQADGFVRRQQERDREAERLARERPSPSIAFVEWPRRPAYHGHGWPLPADAVYPALPTWGYGAYGGYGVSGAYTSSPGAAQGRSGGFIGSGFSTAR